MLPSSYSCPRCKCSALCRQRRKGLDWLFSAIGLRPVICLTCGKKSHIHLNAKDLTPATRTRKPYVESHSGPQQVPSKPRKAA